MPLTTIDPSFINNPDGTGPTYDAAESRKVQGFTLVAGVTGQARGGLLNIRDLALSISGSNLLCGPGGAVVPSGGGAYVTGLSAADIVGTITAADATNPRRDRVVLEILDPDNGGGAGRKGQIRLIDGTADPLATSGGGFPPAPTSPYLDLGFVDVPKAGSGSPAITSTPPLTATAGGVLPVRSKAERDALPKWNGLQIMRLDLAGRPVETWDGAAWSALAEAAPLNVSGWANSGVATVVPEGGKKRVTIDFELKRTGANLAIGTGFTVLGTIIPPIAQGGTSPVKYLTCAISGGSNNTMANAAVNPGGAISIRGVSAFTFTTGALITINVVYYI